MFKNIKYSINFIFLKNSFLEISDLLQSILIALYSTGSAAILMFPFTITLQASVISFLELHPLFPGSHVFLFLGSIPCSDGTVPVLSAWEVHFFETLHI